MSFDLTETTIDAIGASLRAGELSCRELVESYLARIDAYDREGPRLGAVVALNPRALEEADRLDAELRAQGEQAGPLHGVPVLVKDQIETEGITTTFGSAAFVDHVPARDAPAIARMCAAGAIVLGKTLLPDFATSWFALSSAGGEAKNPYALDRDPGGSSSGTAAAVAANLAAVGVGEDTGGSIRLPSSFCNVVGLRVTTGLISRTGMSPLVVFQDTAGPVARTVRDAALLLDALIGWDPADPFTAATVNQRWIGSYANAIDREEPRGLRIGVLRDAFGAADDPLAQPVAATVEAALGRLADAGAELVDVQVAGLDGHIARTSLYLQQSKHDIDAFLAERPGAVTVEELRRDGRYHPGLDLFEQIAEGPDDPAEDPATYYRGLAERETFRRALLGRFAAERLDALAFPTTRVLPPTKQEVHDRRWTVLTFPTNTLIAAQSDLPALSLPAGFADGTVPVGLELVGRPFDEAGLLRMAAAVEVVLAARRAPSSAPPLG